ncbi:Glycosyltransferase [Mucinivorans hirudinis]|uniref:Glycosyltransferase n=1 Tax=Mucinivorans hirudinis TaxID=1433126 RepID=A0A060R5U1_9BACT|nr:Glycosyltransferase [Mucinivorans hirudinis]
MRTIYIFDEHQSSCNNGIGTYIRELNACLSDTEYKIIKISCNADVDEFEIDTIRGVIYFPQFQYGNFTDNSEAISTILALHILDDTNNLFIINHSPSNQLLIEMKEVFPKSKFLFVIHDMCWTAQLMGDSKLLLSTEDYALKIRIEQEKEMIDIVDYVVCLNNETYKVIKDIYSIKTEGKVFVISNGLSNDKKCGSDRNTIMRELYLDRDEPLVLFVGRLTYAKGLKVLIDAFEIVLKTIPKMRLVLVGTHDPLFARVSISSRLASRIIFTGHISKEELSKWYTVSDIGVIPSFSEQCSFVAIEMMMYSLAIIYADSFGLRCMFDNGNDGCIVMRNENFTENLASIIIELNNNNELRQKFQHNAANSYTKKYSSEIMRRNYITMLNKIYDN